MSTCTLPPARSLDVPSSRFVSTRVDKLTSSLTAHSHVSILETGKVSRRTYRVLLCKDKSIDIANPSIGSVSHGSYHRRHSAISTLQVALFLTLTPNPPEPPIPVFYTTRHVRMRPNLTTWSLPILAFPQRGPLVFGVADPSPHTHRRLPSRATKAALLSP